MITYSADGSITLIDDPYAEEPRVQLLPAGMSPAEVEAAIVAFFSAP